MHAHFLVDGRIERTSDVAQIRAAHLAGRTLWLELGERSEAAEALMQETFAIHPLVIEDIFTDRPAPKLELFAGYLYVVVHALKSADASSAIELGVLDVVIGPTFLLTQHTDGPASERLRVRLERSPGLLAKGPAWLAHAFVDAIIDRFVPLIDGLSTRVDAAELRVLDVTDDGAPLLPELVTLRRSIQALCRISHHQSEILRRLSKTEYPQIPAAARAYYRDVHDHFSRVEEEADACKDLIGNVVDAHLSVQSNRMNEAVKRLTLISTVMLPLNVIASFFGMNFTSLPGLTSRWGYLYVTAFMISVSVAIWGYFARRRWV